MIKPSCFKAGPLIAARASGLSRADGLWLEEHIGGCETCAHEAALLTAMSITPAPGYALIGFGFAAVLGVAVVATVMTRGAEQPAQAHIANAPAPSGVQEQLRAGALVRTQARVQVALAHASIELAPQSEARWNAAARELSLPAGELLAEVDPSVHRSFVVITKDFRVEVLGTRFEVTQSSVVVRRGRVRIASLSGEERAVLNAGERYDVAPSVEAAAPEPPPRAQHAEPTATNVPALLTEARDALAAGRFERSRRAIEGALAAKPQPTARAEALTLRAELLNAQGDRAAAVAAYLEVATRFDTLAAGENALFAAARLHRDAAAARDLLKRYLERYPRGRFVVEAKYRLERARK